MKSYYCNCNPNTPHLDDPRNAYRAVTATPDGNCTVCGYAALCVPDSYFKTYKKVTDICIQMLAEHGCMLEIPHQHRGSDSYKDFLQTSDMVYNSQNQSGSLTTRVDYRVSEMSYLTSPYGIAARNIK